MRPMLGMTKNETPYLLVLLFGILLLGCGQKKEEEKEMSPSERRAFQDSLLKENRRLARKEDRAIEDYIDRYGWEMERSGTGLRYMIEKEGDGKKARKGMLAKVDYRVELLTGDLVYSSDSTGPKSFLIGKDDEVTGLHEGIQYMREGGEAVFIIPAHLAHGLLGDLDRIPMHSALVYHIELLDLRTPRRRRR